MNINYDSVVFNKNINELKTMYGEMNVNSHLSVENPIIIKNLDFGRTYYIFYNNNLIAFKIHAFSLVKELFLVQMPNCFKWLNLKNYRLFNTKEEYFLYLECMCNPIKIETTIIDISKFPYFKIRWSGASMELRNGYKWDKGHGKPFCDLSYVYDILLVESGFVIYYKLRENCFNTYEECVKHNLDGMVIEDFEEEIPTITITFKTETKPKIHTLRFIEE